MGECIPKATSMMAGVAAIAAVIVNVVPLVARNSACAFVGDSGRHSNREPELLAVAARGTRVLGG